VGDFFQFFFRHTSTSAGGNGSSRGNVVSWLFFIVLDLAAVIVCQKLIGFYGDKEAGLMMGKYYYTSA